MMAADTWLHCLGGSAAGPWGSIRAGEIRLIPKPIADAMLAACPDRFVKLKGAPTEPEAVAMRADVYPPGERRPFGVSYHNLEPLP